MIVHSDRSQHGAARRAPGFRSARRVTARPVRTSPGRRRPRRRPDEQQYGDGAQGEGLEREAGDAPDVVEGVVDAEEPLQDAGEQRGPGADQDPGVDQGGAGQEARVAEGDAVGPRDVGAAQPEHHQRGDDHQVGQQQGGDGHGEHDREDGAGVAVGELHGGQHEHGGHRPDSRLVRTGVPSRGWKAPRARVKNAPSAAAMACMRSLTIIQALPWVRRAKTNMTAVRVSTGRRRRRRCRRRDVRLHEPADAGELVGGDHGQEGEDRQQIAAGGDGRGAPEGGGHVALRVVHLLAGGVRGLEADVGEQQDGDEGEEAGRGRGEPCVGEPLEAVFDAVEHGGEGEQREGEDLHQRAGRGDPLASAQGDDGREDGGPDEQQLERVVGEGAGAEGEDEAVPGLGGEEDQGAAEPDRVGDPVEQRRERGRRPAEGEFHPYVGAALLGNAAPVSANSRA